MTTKKKEMDLKISKLYKHNQQLEEKIQRYQFEREETKKLNDELKELVANQSIRLGNLEKISLAKGTRRNSNSEKNIIQNQKNRLISILKKLNFLPSLIGYFEAE